MNGSLLILLFAFVLGSVPFGLLMARIFGRHDPRVRGSGNIGATNVSRVAGFWPAGLLTFVLDSLKGTAAVALSGSSAWSLPGSDWVSGHIFFAPGWEPDAALLRWSAGFFAVLGHCYSPWLRLRGGKGVATALGTLALLAPLAGLGGVLAFGIAFVSFRTGSLASLCGLLVAAVVYGVYPSSQPGAHLWAGALMFLVVIARHEKNIDALLEDRESRF